MKKIITASLLTFTTLSLMACSGGDKTVEETSKEATKAVASKVTNHAASYSKADFMKACETGMTAAQCDCFVDFYKSIGLEVSDLGDQAKVTAAVTGLKPEETMKMAQCMQ